MNAVALAMSNLGRHGPAILVCSLLIGLVFKPLSDASIQLLPASALLLTLGSFLTAALSPRENVGRKGRIVLVLIFVGIIVPILTWAILKLIHLSDAVGTGVMVASLAPPVGSAAAMATMLGLRPRLALAVSIFLTLISPVLMPLAIKAAGLELATDFTAVAYRLFAIVVTATLITAAIMHFRKVSMLMLPDPSAAAGISVIGLVIVGLAVSSGVTPLVLHRGTVADLFGLSVALNVAACVIGSVSFLWWLGYQEALTIGLLSGNRNVTLAWAVAGASLPTDAQSYLAVSVVPVLALPLVIKAIVQAMKILGLMPVASK